MKIVLAIVLMGAVVGLQAVHERRGGPPATASGNLLYVRSPEAMNRLALSYDALLADLYWLRAVQHYGSTKLSTDVNKEYDLLYPLLDLTTSLDPRFSVAYYFGSIFLAEPPPAGPGRPEQAITLLRKGLIAQPDKWEYAQAIGFVYYWWLEDYTQAAAWFKTAAAMPNAPVWMTSLAANTLAQGGSRDSSRLLWQQIADTAESEWFRAEAARRLLQLDAMDQIDELQRAVNAFRMREGRVVSGWNELQQAGYLIGRPADPTGVMYLLESGTVSLDRKSRLFPLPAEPIPPPA